MPVKFSGNGFPDGLILPPVFQGRLTYDTTTNLKLTRFNGTWLTIGGVPRQIPAAGADIASSAFTAGTMMSVYAAWNGTAITLEASTTGRVTDANYGYPVKTGDASRTFLGLVMTETGIGFQDSLTKRYILNCFNRQPIVASGVMTASRGQPGGASAYIELHAEVRANFLAFANQPTMMLSEGIILFDNAPSGYNVIWGAGLDGAGPAQAAQSIGSATASVPFLTRWPIQGISEGNHYVTISMYNPGATGAAVYGNTGDGRSGRTLVEYLG